MNSIALMQQIEDMSYRIRELEGATDNIFGQDIPKREAQVAPVGFSVSGTKELYKGIFLREYDEDGVIVDIGDETDPLPEGRTLRPTWDYVRAV